MAIRKIVADYLIEYFDKKEIKYRKYGKVYMTDCPFCSGQESVNIFLNSKTFHCGSCEKSFDLVDYVAVIDKVSDPEAIQKIKDLLNIDVTTSTETEQINEVFDFYESQEFDLVPVASNDKYPVEKAWPTKTHKDKGEWKEWYINGLNMGIKTGKVSGITVLDIDTKDVTDVKLKELLKQSNTLQQETTKGTHHFYKYEASLPKTRIDEFKLDLQNDGGQVVVFPSKVEGFKRTIVPADVKVMPPELIEYLKSKIHVPVKTNSEQLREEIQTENFKIDPAKFELKNNNLEGSCNTEFVKLGGVFRKQFAQEDVRKIMYTLNKHLLAKPMDSKSIEGMIKKLDDYAGFDENELANKILKYIKDADEATSRDVLQAIGEQKAKVDKCLAWLLREGYIIKRGQYFKALQKVEWQTSFMEFGKLLPFKVPYFSEYATFRNGDCIVIAAPTGYGKTHIAMNIVKEFKRQHILVNYIPSEGGGRWSIIAQRLGLKEGDFKFPSKRISPEQVELEDNAITIIDWLLPKDYSQTDKIFQHFDEQLQKHGGLLYVFVQLRSGTQTFYANDMLEFFPSWVCKFLYEKAEGDKNDRSLPYFETTKIREGKNGFTHAKIPCKYNNQTKEINTIEQLEAGDSK